MDPNLQSPFACKPNCTNSKLFQDLPVLEEEAWQKKLFSFEMAQLIDGKDVAR